MISKMVNEDKEFNLMISCKTNGIFWVALLSGLAKYLRA